MEKYKIFDIALFVVSVAIGLYFAPLEVDLVKYIAVFCIYLFFSIMYTNYKVIQGNGTATYDYGMSYSQSFALFAGPFGLLIFEIFYRFSVYFQRKITKTADADEFTDTFFNIGTFVIYNTIAYIFFMSLYPFFENVPFGYSILFLLAALVIMVFANSFLLFSLYLSGNIHSWNEVSSFLKRRSMLDIVVKNALTNGLLYYFVMENQWEMLIVLLSLNYVVSKSFLSKQENRQNEIERDYFKEMAYTDFMTGLANRAMMDKQMSEINGSNEVLGIVVIDIDKFKRINDNYNHAVGDLVIQHFAKMLKSRVRKNDQVFRSGGEEFTLFLRDRTYEECIECLEGLRTQVSEQPAEVEFNGEMTQISYTVSCGLYYNAMVEELPMERAYIYADQLLLEAKGRGRNRLVVKNGLETYK
ncbi:GGDEF domain-containing protein [Paenisporosarcina quisquiliarum]|uniref:GGDEF domain-containing protein n=1 Tax=Paenisporosarcina quisquiliarum TaxID=365346 RepID=UPI003736E840